MEKSGNLLRRMCRIVGETVLPGMWANFIVLIVMILMLFGFFESWLSECGMTRVKAFLLLFGVVMGDWWQFQWGNCQLSILPLFLFLYLAVESLDSKRKEAFITLFFSLLTAVFYVLWCLLVPLEPAMQIFNHTGVAGISIGVFVSAFIRSRLTVITSMGWGMLIGEILHVWLSHIWLSDQSSYSLLDGAMKDDWVCACVSAGVMISMRIAREQILALFKRKWRSVYSEGDAT